MDANRTVALAALVAGSCLLSGGGFAGSSPSGGEPREVAGQLAAGERLWLAGAHAPALSSLEATRALARRQGDRRLEAASLDLIASVHDSQGLSKLGATERGEALELAVAAADRALEARVLAHAGLGFWTRAEYLPARERCERALSIQRQIGDASGEAQTLVYRGLISLKQGEYAAAQADLQRALAIQEASGEGAAQARTLAALGHVDRDRHLLASALERYRRALEIAEALGDAGASGDLLIEIGVTFLVDGAEREAVAHFQRALEIASRGSGEAARGRALHHLGIAYSSRGWYDRALECFAAALEVQDAMGDLREQAWTWERVGRVRERQGDDRRALLAYQRAMALRDEISDRRALASQLNAVAAVYERLGDDPRSIATLQRAEALAREIRLPYLSLTLGALGRTYARLGRREEALAYGEEAVDEAEAVGNLQMRWSSLYDLGSIQLALGMPEVALRSWRRSLALIEELRAGAIAEDEAKTAYMETKQEVYAAAVRLLAHRGEAAAALELAERARARAFLDLLGGREATLRGSAASLRLANLEPPQLAQLQGLARRSGETILEYFVTDDAVLIWVLSPDGAVHAAVSRVPRRELEDLVDATRRGLRADVAARDWQAAEDHAVFGESPVAAPPAPVSAPPLRRLHDLLVAPVEEWLPRDPERPVILVPHGKLFLVSFAALRDAEDRYLVERHVLHYSPAIGVLRYTAAERAPHLPALLVVGNPAMPTLPGRDRPLPPLPGAELEARTIATLYPAERVTALTGVAAAERAVSALAGGRTILHLATHGVVRDDDPLESLLALAPEEGAGPDSDGLWTVREIFGLRLSADLVTLSACNTGLGRVNGDGVIGLSRAFLYAGAPSVLVSLWRVADGVTRFEMERFYRTLISNRGDKAAALRRAQLDTIAALRGGRLRGESGRALAEDPAYWAPFVLVGEAR